MENIKDHYETVFETELDKLKLKDKVRWVIEGPSLVPVPPQMGGGLTVGWNAMVAIKHTVLLGRPDVAVHVPIVGILPEDNVVRECAKFLLENARAERHKLSTLTDEEILAGQAGAVPRNGQGDPLSAMTAGFKAIAEGKKVGGD